MALFASAAAAAAGAYFKVRLHLVSVKCEETFKKYKMWS
jgi:hypothetical protein